MGKTVFTVLGAVAELERSLIAERVLAGEDFQAPQGNPRLSAGSLFNPWLERLAPLSARMELWRGTGLESRRVLAVTVR